MIRFALLVTLALPACAPQPCITRVDRIHFANACLAPCHQIQDKPYEYREPPPHHSEWINEFRAAYVTKTCPDDE